MLPKKLLRIHSAGPELTPRYLDARDRPWLRALLDVYQAFSGRRRRELEERLREPLEPMAPKVELARAVYVLDRLCGERLEAVRAPRQVRAALFGEAARGGARRDVVERVAGALELSPHALLEALFADIPAERRLVGPPASLEPSELALRVNLALAQGLVARATELQIDALGNARDLVRYAQLRGLLCVARAGSTEDRFVLEVSGPLALFRRTRVYGAALSGLLPRLPWCSEFRLRAEIELGRGRRTLVVRTGDPIFPAREPKRFDSKLEARFAREFAKAAPDWHVTREPRPVPVDGTLIFPDFLLRHRRHGDRAWLLEIVGFWTETYLEKKLRRLAAAALPNLILCVDVNKAGGRSDLPVGPAVVPFRRRIDVRRVLAIIGS